MEASDGDEEANFWVCWSKRISKHKVDCWQNAMRLQLNLNKSLTSTAALPWEENFKSLLSHCTCYQALCGWSEVLVALQCKFAFKKIKIFSTSVHSTHLLALCTLASCKADCFDSCWTQSRNDYNESLRAGSFEDSNFLIEIYSSSTLKIHFVLRSPYILLFIGKSM